MGEEPAARAREHGGLSRILRGLTLSMVSILAVADLLLTSAGAAAHAWTWLQLGLSSLLVLASLAGVLGWPRNRRVRWAALALALLGLTRIGWAVAPRDAPRHPGALVRARIASADATDGAAPRLWFQGIPERETVRLGALLGLSRRERAEDLPAIEAAYAEIEAGDLFERAESPLLDSWLFDRAYFWLAAPPGPGPFPLIIFIHGNGGNFQVYPHLLARAAVERGLAIAFPTHGLGLWQGSEAAPRIASVVDAVAREVPIDHSRIALAGLSAGALGAFATARADPGRYRAIAAISGVFPDLSPCESLRETTVLILHGTDDPRAPIERARRAQGDLARAGVPVDLREELGADHLALLTGRDRWVPLLLDWLAARLR